MSGRAKMLTLHWVPVSLKSWSWNLARSLCDSGSITKYCAPIIYKSREESYDIRRMDD
jgi:hypothetical protein